MLLRCSIQLGDKTGQAIGKQRSHRANESWAFERTVDETEAVYGVTRLQCLSFLGKRHAQETERVCWLSEEKVGGHVPVRLQRRAKVARWECWRHPSRKHVLPTKQTPDAGLDKRLQRDLHLTVPHVMCQSAESMGLHHGVR